jgi:hypothetical protein
VPLGAGVIVGAYEPVRRGRALALTLLARSGMGVLVLAVFVLLLLLAAVMAVAIVVALVAMPRGLPAHIATAHATTAPSREADGASAPTRSIG